MGSLPVRIKSGGSVHLPTAQIDVTATLRSIRTLYSDDQIRLVSQHTKNPVEFVPLTARSRTLIVGNVIPFQSPLLRRNDRTISSSAHRLELAVLASAQSGHDTRGVLAAAGPLMSHMTTRFGFTVMADGLPMDPRVLADALVGLSRGLSRLSAIITRRPLVTVGVYFGHDGLAWFEDGYDEESGLKAPDTIDAPEFAAFVSARFKAQARG